MMEDILRFKGVITALLTPYSKHGEPLSSSINELIQFQAQNGISGFFVLGTYGEGMLLTVSQRKRFLEKIVEYAPSHALLIVNVTHTSIDSSLELALHARDVGVPAISAMLPLYYKFNDNAVIGYYKSLSRAELPILIYNNPQKQGYDLSLELFSKIASETPLLAGIKDSTGSLERAHLLVRDFGEKMFIGIARDHLIFYSMLLGANAHICGISNVFPEIVKYVFDFIASKNYEKALSIQGAIIDFRNRLRKLSCDSPMIMKELLSIRGINMGVPVPPQVGLKKKEKIVLRKEAENFVQKLRGVGINLSLTII